MDLGPNFKLVFLTVVGLTLVSLGVMVGVAIFGSDSDAMSKDLLDTCSTTFKLGFGAVIGLVGGKALT